MTSLWNIRTGTRISTAIERQEVTILLPLANSVSTSTEIISGSLPPGAQLEGNSIVGTLFEVAFNKNFTVVIRAEANDVFEDRTLEFAVSGPDEPQWVTNKGLLPIGANDALFILDNTPIDFQLIATDTDIPAGDELSYYIANDDGVLPPGITLSEDGRLQGITEPLLSLDKQFLGGGYDTMPFGGFPMDYNVLSGNGFSSYFYDTQDYGFSEPTSSFRKLNRYYPFAVTVSDGTSVVRREFKIYLVGDDFLTADNTVMQASTGIFTADSTNIRTPIWLTPGNLGFRRANNYTTLYLDTIDGPTLDGVITYTLEAVNDDGTASKLPSGLSLDSQNGEVTGIIPYQPAITIDYKFTVRATRITADLGIVSIVANYYEDTMLGKNSFKIFKIDLTGDLDGINDLFELVGRDILLENRLYRVINVDDRNSEYDIIFLENTLAPSISINLSRTATVGTDYLFVNRLTERSKDKYNKRTLRFAEDEAYTIDTITPYIEYEVSQTNPSSSNNEIAPSDSPRDLTTGENYFVGDYVVYTPESGGNGFVYKCTESHNTAPQVDINDNIIFDSDGNIQILFESNKWTQVAETIDELSLADKVTATIQTLEDIYNNKVFITVLADNRWRIRLPSTASSRIISKIRDFFTNSSDSGSLEVILLRNNEDLVQLDKNLSRKLNQGMNVGVALFARDFFEETIIVAENDEVDIPSSVKTFDLSVLGEIDSNISWITPADLGSINANFTSVFNVEAETTVPDSRMIYTLIDGRLPFGMSLQYNGEIIGAPKQFNDADGLGLTVFDNKTVSWDGKIPGDTTFDRVYRFTVKALDRFAIVAIERTFIIRVEDLDNTLYTDIYARPMLPEDQRSAYSDFVSTLSIFDPGKIYRLGDPTFGIQTNLDMLIYAGIEAKDIGEFVAAAAKNHKRKQYGLGEFKYAVAIDATSQEEIYEVIYIDVKDFAQTSKGKTKSKFKIRTPNKITVDSLQYAAIDDNTGTGVGYDSLPVYGRGGFVRFITSTSGELVIETRDGDVEISADNADFEVELFDTSNVVVNLEKSNSEPYRIRPTPTNTIKTDSNAIKTSQSKDTVRYRASIEHMRDNIKAIGKNERNYLPLWMRTPQNELQELGYITAIPVCYCNPGEADNILARINNSDFDPKIINYDIDRYIVKRTDGSLDEQFVLFANYQFNV